MSIVRDLPVGTFFVNRSSRGDVNIFERTETEVGLYLHHSGGGIVTPCTVLIRSATDGWWKEYEARVIDDDLACKLLAMIALGADVTPLLEEIYA